MTETPTGVGDHTPACEECGNDIGPYTWLGRHLCLDCLAKTEEPCS